MATDFEIAVVGGGVAGLTAAWHAALGGGAVAHLLGDEPLGGLVQNVGELHGYPSGAHALSGAGLADALSATTIELGVAQTEAAATSITREGGGFRIAHDGGEIRAAQVIAATGARLRALDAPGAEKLRGRGVSQCAWCDGALAKGKEVVVVGGGDAALEEALHLTKFASKLTIITRGDGFRARQSYVERIAEHETVDFRWSSEVVEVVGEHGVEAVVVHDRESGETERLPCFGVFVFIGSTPNAEPLGDLVERDADGRVLTDAAMETATPGLFAVGAVRSGYGGRLVHAVGEAATAAIAAVARGAE